MTYEDIRTFHRAVPFVPFTLHTTDGRSFTIERPLEACWTRDRSRFVLYTMGATGTYLSLDSIARIESAATAEA